MHFDAGKLNKRISFITTEEKENELGQTVQGDVVYKTVWASVEPLRGYEQTEEQRLRPETVYRITTRYHKDIHSNMFILYGTKRLRITQIINVEERSFCLEIMATNKVKDNG